MKRLFINDLPWADIQLKYNDGMSFRDIEQKFGISSKTLHKAKQLNLFVSRNKSDAGKFRILNKPNDYTLTRQQRPALINYRADCAFKFNLGDYPEEFDFTLIALYGWYKPKNRGNNLNGVSRDHAVSVRYGFDNNIPAHCLAHPANCVLMRHCDNVAKYSKISMSYEELFNRIEEWDSKYLGV